MPYDVVGISGILPNIGKVKLMCEIVRRHQPGATIVVGGHIANRPGLRDVVDADHVVAGEGVAWFRAFLGEERGRAGPASAHRLRSRRADDGRALRPGRGRDGGHRDPVGRLPARLQLLLDLGHVRGQGPLLQLLRGRGRALRGDAGPRGGAEDALLLRHGRELPPPPQAGPAPPGADARAREGVGPLRLQLGERAAAVHGRRARGPRRLLGLARPRGGGQRLREAQGHRLPRSRSPAPGPRHPRPRLEHRRAPRARGRQHRPRHRPRGRARHRVPPVHALHPGAGDAAPRRAPGERHPALVEGVPRRRHPRAAAFQLPPPAHPERRGDGVPAAGLPPRLRGERPERHPHRAHPPPGLARPEGPPRPARAREGRLRDEGPADTVRGGAVGLRALVRAVEPGARRPAAGHAARDRAGVRVEGAPRRAPRRPGGARDAVARGAPPAPRPDVRAPDLLRGEPGRLRATRGDRARRRPCRWVEPPARAAEANEAVA